MTDILPKGCSDVPKFEFEIVVHEPDPKAPDIAHRKNAMVVATYKGEQAGEILYGYVGEEIWITRMHTEEKFRCRGCATQMYQSLVAHYPDQNVKDGGNSNDAIGDIVLDRWREKGIYNDE